MLERPFKFGNEAFHYTVKRNDGDNLIKLVWDGCTSVGLWEDDGQISEWDGFRLYSKIGGAPGVALTVETLGEHPADLFEKGTV